MRRFLAAVLAGSIVCLAGCSNRQAEPEPKEAKTETVEKNQLIGTLKIDGSTTIYPITKKAAEIFMQKNPQVKIEVAQSSSGDGIAKFLKKEIDIADATRHPYDEEYKEGEAKGMNLLMTVVSNDAVAIVVHKTNPLRNITSEQLDKIFFTGEISDWAQVTNGQKKGKIHVYGTDTEKSGTADLFIEKINKGGKVVEGYTVKYPTPTIVPTVADDPDGIAFTPLKWVNDSVVLLSLDNIIPDKSTVLNAQYKLSRKMLMITDGKPKGLTRDFINFVLSHEGQKIVEEEGFISIDSVI